MREFHVKFHLKNRYRTHRFAIRAISVFRVKFNVEFPHQVMDFPIILYISGVFKVNTRRTTINVLQSNDPIGAAN